MSIPPVRTIDRRTVATRAALIETAERLFAERGIESVSLRDVNAAAGQRNHTASQYHFGDRTGLVGAVFENRVERVYELREMMFDAMTERPPDGIEEMVAALVVPLCEAIAESKAWFGRFLARCLWDSFAWNAIEQISPDKHRASFERCLRMLATYVPDLPPAIRRTRFDQMVWQLIGTLSRWEAQSPTNPDRLSLGELERDLVSTITAMLRAPAEVSTPAT